MKKIISYFLSGIVLCTALLVTPVSAAEVAPAEETITINSTVSGLQIIGLRQQQN